MYRIYVIVFGLQKSEHYSRVTKFVYARTFLDDKFFFVFKMTNSGGCEFQDLLVEAWDHIMMDDQLKGLPKYWQLRKWLANLTYSCPRGNDELIKLKTMIDAMRTCNKKAMEECLEAGPPICTKLPKRCRRKEPQSILDVKAATDNRADCRLLAALATVDECISLQRFFREVAVHTCDRGQLLMRITADVLADFRSFVDTVFSNRVTQIGLVLGREQIAIRDRYAELEARTMNRAQLSLLHVRLIMPTFVWQRYVTEKGYLKSVVVSKCMQDTQADDLADAEDLRGKSLLYQLNWLRSEIDRADSENHSLHEQHTEFTADLASINRKIAEVQCRAANDMSVMANELNRLRAQSADQVCLIDKLMETIQISMQNSKADSAAATTACAARR